MKDIKYILTWLLDSIDITNVNDFSMAVFSIAITLFTLLYSFINGKREIKASLRSKIKKGTASVEEQVSYSVANIFILKSLVSH